MASIIANFAAGLFNPLYAIFVERIGGDILSASGAYAVFAVSTGILIMILGRLEDHRFKKEKMVFLGYFTLALGNLSYYFVYNPSQLFFTQALIGIGIAFIEPAWDAIYSKSIDRGKESSEWSLWAGGINIMLGLGAVAGGIFVSFFGFRLLFAGMFLLDTISAFIAMRLLEESRT